MSELCNPRSKFQLNPVNGVQLVNWILSNFHIKPTGLNCVQPCRKEEKEFERRDFKSRTRGTAVVYRHLVITQTQTMGDLAVVSLRVRTWFFMQLWRCMSYGYNKEKTSFWRPDTNLYPLVATKMKNTIDYQPPLCAYTQILIHR